MNWLSTVLHRLGMNASATQTLDQPGWLTRVINGQSTHAGTHVSETTALTLPTVYAAVGIIADAVAQLPLSVYQRSPEGRHMLRDHPVHHLLHDAPNEHMTAFTYRNTKQHHVLLWGNGYSEIERTRGGAVAGLWPLLPDRTYPSKDPDGTLYYQTSVAGRAHRLAHTDVLHIPALGFDGYIGYSPIALARQALGLALATEEFGAKFFGQGSRGSAVLKHPGKLSDPAHQRLKESFSDAYEGLENAHRVRILEEGMDFVQTSIPPEEAQFLQTREFQIAEIARMFRVPLWMLQSHTKDTSWGSGIEQMGIGFLLYTLTPWLVRIEQECNRKLFSPKERAAGLYVKFNTAALMRGDARTRSEYLSKAVGRPWMSVDEARRLEELNDMGIDDIALPTSLSPTPPSQDTES